MKTLRAGIIGLGWGSLVHVPAFRSAAGFEPVALCAQDAARLSQAGERVGIADLSTDWPAFARRSDLDVISIATPVPLHLPMVEAAFAAGKHVICEKPAGLDAPQVEEMVRLAASAGTNQAIAFELRYLPEHLALAAMVRSGETGRPVAAQLTRNQAMWHPSLPPVAAWKLRLDQGGGFLNAVTSHDLDLVRQLFGEPTAVCADVQATLGRSFTDWAAYAEADAEDTVALLMRTSEGASISIGGTAASINGSGYRLEVIGTEGSIELRDGRLYAGRLGDEGRAERPIAHRNPAGPLAVDTTYALFPQVRAMALLLEDWLPAFRGEPSRAPTFADALQVQRAIDAARASAAGAGWVQLG